MRLVTGCDVVDIARLAGAIARRPGLRDRVFTPHELADVHRGGVDPDSEVAHARLAARFAAKEATRKALREMRLPFHAVEVRCADDGAPELYLHGRPAALACSLSHDGGVAMAVVVGPAPGADDAHPTDDPDPTDDAHHTDDPDPTDDPDLT